jgi:two-component system LytT family sensor kinase
MMIDFLKRQANFAKIEFWAFTTLFAFVLFFFITDGLDSRSAIENAPFRSYFEKANIPYSYYNNYFIPQFIRNIVLFLGFSSLNFIVVPKIIKREALWQNILLFFLIFLISGVVFGITNTYLKAFLYTNSSREEMDRAIFQDGFEYTFSLLVVLLIYTAIKYSGLFLLAKSELIQSKFRLLSRETIVALFIWIVILMLLVIGDAESEFLLGWAILIPNGIVLYSYSFHKMIPRLFATKRRPIISYLIRCVIIIAATFVAVFIMLLIFIDNEDIVFDFSFFNMVFQLFVTVPVTWLLYKRHISGNEEVTVLKKELKQSTANIDFLRSQINPHFLFNALNTIYGTAIQEKAERTSEGIEKLGDMMRFMLQENMQEKISLSREIDYLNNYIGLQKLRTDTHPNIQIHTEIHSRETIFQIAPMLLIPFVENAFKHGISFREPSHIKVLLEIKNNTLYFDVYNSRHSMQDNDPEKDKSGIGLENVQQRLKLLYPGRHELVIRETSREFFIHLTIQLT